MLLIYYQILRLARRKYPLLFNQLHHVKNSGFYDYILPFIFNDTGIKANIVAVGSGAAIRNSMNCDGDILIVHSPQQEKHVCIFWIYRNKSLFNA